MEEPLCPVCNKNVVEQTHHLSYKPEITIPICIPCHINIHHHGVGTNGKPSIPIRQQPHDHGTFTTTLYADDDAQPYLCRTFVDAQTHQPLTELCCGCQSFHGEHGVRLMTDWQLWHNTQQDVFLKCVNCGRDVKIQLVEGATFHATPTEITT